MLSRLRDLGPILLIPAAWTVAAAAEQGFIGEQSIFIAHLLMAAFITFFIVTGWRLMEEGALRTWRTTLIAGLGLVFLGIAGFIVTAGEGYLLGASLVGWMVLPVYGLAITARELPEARTVYGGAAMLCVVGAGVFVLSRVILDGELVGVGGIAIVAVGQTGSIIDASRR